MKLTRRETSRLLVASVAASALPLPAAAASSQKWAQRLQRELQARFVYHDMGTIELQRFGMARRSGGYVMAGVVRLDWPPGERRRRYEASGKKEKDAFNQLLALTLVALDETWPGCVTL